jgi:hypothetical protein
MFEKYKNPTFRNYKTLLGLKNFVLNSKVS